MGKAVQLSIVFCSLLVLLTGCFALPVEEEVLPPPAAIMPEARPLRTTSVTRDDVVLFVNVRAEYIPAQQETVHFGIAGQRIRGVPVSVGDFVNEGDVVAELSRPYLFTQLEDVLRDQELALLDLRHVGARHDLAINHAARIGIPVDDSMFLEDMRRVQDRLSIINRRIAYLNDEIDGLYVRSPFDGVVLWALNVTGVMWSYVGQQAVIISDQSEHIFSISGPGANVAQVGMYFEIVIDDEAFLSVVIDPAVYGIPESANAYLRVVEGELPFITGATVAMVHVVLDRSINALAVPNLAVHTVEGRQFVYVVENDLLVLRDVVVGLVGNFFTEIISGLEEGEVVVI